MIRYTYCLFIPIAIIMEAEVHRGGTMTDRKTLYALVDQIVDEDMEEARRLLKDLVETRER